MTKNTMWADTANPRVAARTIGNRLTCNGRNFLEYLQRRQEGGAPALLR